MNTKNVIEIAIECGAVIDVLCMGRHDNVVFTSGEIQRFVQRIEQPYVDTIEDLHDEIGRLREALQVATDTLKSLDCTMTLASVQQIADPTWRLVSGYMVTETGIGTYAIDHDAGYYMIIFNDDKYRALYDTEAEAIAAANADYRKRVLSCFVYGGIDD